MSTNAQVAYQAAAVKGESEREADLEARVADFYAWLQTQTTTSEVQSVTEGGSGLTSFTLTFSGQTTGAIVAAATAAALQTALEALSNVDPGDVAVTGSASGPWNVAYGGQYAGVNVPQMTATPTGGSGTVTVATVTAGGAGAGGNIIGNAQAALLAASHAYDAREGTERTSDVLAAAAAILTDITAHSAGNGS